MWWILSTDTSWAIALPCVRLRTAKRWKTKIQISNTMTGEWVAFDNVVNRCLVRNSPSGNPTVRRICDGVHHLFVWNSYSLFDSNNTFVWPRYFLIDKIVLGRNYVEVRVRLLKWVLASNPVQFDKGGCWSGVGMYGGKQVGVRVGLVHRIGCLNTFIILFIQVLNIQFPSCH